MTVERVRVGDVLRLERFPVDPTPDLEYTSIGLRSFGKGIFHYEAKTGDRLGSLRFFEVRPERLVVSNIKGWEGAIAVSADSDAGCIASNRFLSYAPVENCVDVGWARWFFLSEPGIELIQRASPGSADRNRTLAIDRFEALEIPLPPLDEQRRVAARLSGVAGVAERVGILRGKAGVLAAALPGAIANQLESSAQLRPTRMGDLLAQVRQPIEIDPSNEYVTMGIRSFGKGIFHYPQRPGSDIGKLRFFSVEPGLLAISNIKAWEGAVAVTTEDESHVVASNRFLFFRPSESGSVEYLRQVLLSQRGLEALGRASPGSADRNRTLAVDRFLDISLRLPRPAEQEAIGMRLLSFEAAFQGRKALCDVADARLAALVPAALNEAFGSLR